MKTNVMSKAARLRELLATKTVAMPGAFNVLAALQIERAGYEALYVSGAALSAVRGLPDIGVLPLEEVVAEAGRIAKAVSIPTIVDADTGFGPPAQVPATVQAFEQAGVAGMQIEDQQLPKKCGHLAGKELVPVAEMAAKVRAAAEAKRDPEFLIVARTDARSVEGMNGAIRRAQAYAEAGADCLYAPGIRTHEDIAEIVKAMAPKPVNVLVGSDFATVAELTALGVRRISVGGALARAAWGGFLSAAREIAEDGTFSTLGRGVPFAEINGLFGAEAK